MIETEQQKVIDIANVLSGFGSMLKRSQGLYEWIGLDKTMQAIAKLEVKYKNNMRSTTSTIHYQLESKLN